MAHPLVSSAPRFIDLTGTVSASSSVDVVSRATGTIEQKAFRDGAFVSRGQVLFRISPESYQAQVAANEAAEAQARDQLALQARLFRDDATSRSALDTARHQLDQARANTRLSRVNLTYTVVRAPISGWTGASSASVGAYVNAGSSRLVTVAQLDPVHVDFTLGEQQVLQILSAMQRRGVDGPAQVGRYPVAVGLSNQTGFPYRGTLDFTQKAIDSSTGSLQARAVVSNRPPYGLLPGMFARVRVALSDRVDHILVPSAIVQSDPLGDFVYVVGSNGTVQRRDIKTGDDIGTNRIVLGGLTVRDRVVVDGLANVRPSEKVAVRSTTLALSSDQQ